MNNLREKEENQLPRNEFVAHVPIGIVGFDKILRKARNIPKRKTEPDGSVLFCAPQKGVSGKIISSRCQKIIRRFYFFLVSIKPAHKAVKGATLTRPKEPTMVWMISADTYL